MCVSSNYYGCGFVGVANCLLFGGNFIINQVVMDFEQCPCSPFLGGFKYTSSMASSISALIVVCFTKVVRFWEGPLREVLLYSQVLCSVLGSNSADVFPVFYWSEKMSSQFKNNYTEPCNVLCFCTLEFHSCHLSTYNSLKTAHAEVGGIESSCIRDMVALK